MDKNLENSCKRNSRNCITPHIDKTTNTVSPNSKTSKQFPQSFYHKKTTKRPPGSPNRNDNPNDNNALQQ